MKGVALWSSESFDNMAIVDIAVKEWLSERFPSEKLERIDRREIIDSYSDYLHFPLDAWNMYMVANRTAEYAHIFCTFRSNHADFEWTNCVIAIVPDITTAVEMKLALS
jgi:hypothetical protein